MPLSALELPKTDPTPIFDVFRGSQATELLAAAVAHFKLFEVLGTRALTLDELRNAIGIESRPAHVLITALKAMGLLTADAQGRIVLTPEAREHLHGGAFDISGYIGLAAKSPGVIATVERLRGNRPEGAEDKEKGAAFVFRDGLESAMEQEAAARSLTMALAGRAKICALYLAARVDLSNARTLLDVGGGTGIYSIACLQKNPGLKAIVYDRPQVLKVAAEQAAAYGVSDRLECRVGDMFKDELPRADVVLLSNILHDWDVPECRTLVKRCAEVLPAGGRLLVHDAFLNDALDGPLAVALYSSTLYTLTEGRAYSAAEYTAWLTEAGLRVSSERVTTQVHCAVLTAGT